jgi:hypothetical protein
MINELIPIKENNNLNNVTNELLLKYDDKFNRQYNKIVSINSSIMNKEEIINRINEEINNKNIKIDVLKYLVIYVLIICGSFILYGLKKINLTILIIIIVLFFIFFGTLIYFNVKNKIPLSIIQKEFKGLVVDMKSLDNRHKNSLKEYECPSTCSPITKESPKRDIINGYASPTLNIDPQTNVWKYGDIPVDSYKGDSDSTFFKDKKILNGINQNSPKQFFGSPSKLIGTYYECVGIDNKKGLPMSDGKKYSEIPCSYRPNYIENARYICSKNPNNLSESEFSNYCNNVTNSISSS